MNPSMTNPDGQTDDKTDAGSLKRHPGFIAFCETNLRYEKGPKAWILLVPYLAGAVILERVIAPEHAAVGWIGFLAYLVFFPTLWQRVVRPLAKKVETTR